MEVWPLDREPDERYRPLPELVAGGLAERICGRLGGAPLRVGQSAVVMGVASRLWSVLLVPAARDGVLVDVADLVARDDDGALVLGMSRWRTRAAPSVDDVDAAARSVLAPVVDLLPLAPRLLWANAAASLRAVPRVHELPEAEPLVAALLARPPYAGELDPDGRRRTCCLFYEVTGAGLCGDCVFDAVPGG
ncbi:(2Fe-2S)-binding protein [Nocardioides mangrovicus]|uniref:(2Fe-2S)-binding protein n=1 Tax=Nocardioides mangrovicus TaxID=2478913 RepID=UPI0011C44B31|nr:(2Fe-2S)-binding protein [Nocardioides mangrovicus]